MRPSRIWGRSTRFTALSPPGAIIFFDWHVTLFGLNLETAERFSVKRQEGGIIVNKIIIIISIMAVSLFALCNYRESRGSIGQLRVMEICYQKWIDELGSELPKSSIGMVYVKNDPLGKLESLDRLLHAPVSDEIWAAFVSEKIMHEMDKPSIALGGHVYLAYGACEKFGWNYREILIEHNSDYRKNTWMLDNELLKKLVARKLSAKGMSGGH